MNILLIGGTGFMGSALAGYFSRQEGNHVVTISRSNNGVLASGDHYNVAASGWDSLIPQLSVYNAWVVIDLAYASVPNTSFADPIKDFSDNLYMVNKHLQNVSKLDVQKYIYISSGGTIYGQVAEVPINELAQNFPLSPYGITKLACERYVHLHYQVHGLNTSIVRPANIYGPGQKPFRGQGFVATALGMAYRHIPVPIFGDGSHERDYLFIDDFCAAIDDVAHFGVSGAIYNVGSGIGLSTSQVLQSINDLLGQESLQLATEFYPGRPFDVRSNVLDSGKIKALNGWEPRTSFKDGLVKTQQWIKQYLETHPQ